jgi:anti-sigma regulatory factor (Ser/Thr protein kinase)
MADPGGGNPGRRALGHGVLGHRVLCGSDPGDSALWDGDPGDSALWDSDPGDRALGDSALGDRDLGGSDPEHGALRHVAFFYRDPAEHRAQMLRFARAGLALGEPLFIAVPAARALGDQLALEPGEFACSDITEAGRNPARLIPELRAFFDQHAGRRVRVVGEPAWPGRSPGEIREVIRHEALVNLAFPKTRATVMCAYDVTRLAPAAISGARLTHPEYLGDGRPAAAPGPAPVWQVPPECEFPLPPPPPSAEALSYQVDLGPVRRLVDSHARRSGLAPERVADLVLAANEIAANTLGHTASGGVLQVWHDETEILCQVDDRGWIADPLAGRVKRPPDGRGHGLFLVNQVCDLVELRTGPGGTTVRMHMSLGDRRPV